MKYINEERALRALEAIYCGSEEYWCGTHKKAFRAGDLMDSIENIEFGDGRIKFGFKNCSDVGLREMVRDELDYKFRHAVKYWIEKNEKYAEVNVENIFKEGLYFEIATEDGECLYNQLINVEVDLCSIPPKVYVDNLKIVNGGFLPESEEWFYELSDLEKDLIREVTGHMNSCYRNEAWWALTWFFEGAFRKEYFPNSFLDEEKSK